MNAKPLLWWTSGQLAWVGSRLQSSWEGWLRSWVPGGQDGARVDGRLAPESACKVAGWTRIGDKGAQCAWLRTTDMGPSLAAVYGFARPEAQGLASQAVAAELWQQARADLAATLRDACGLDSTHREEGPHPELFRAWSGAVLVSLGGDRAGVELLVSAELTQSLLAAFPKGPALGSSRDKLHPLSDALAATSVRASVELAACELDIGTLLGLRLGDVIPMAHPLDAPLSVKLEREVLCAAYLGRQGHNRAIELVRHEARDIPTPFHVS